MANKPTRIKEDSITSLAGNLYNQHKEGEVFVTKKVSFVMRNVLERARKNYLGIYDKPYDSVTGEEKYFPPLTEAFTDGVIKSVDFDTKDIDLFSTNGANVGSLRVIRSILQQKLHEARFGETLNEMLRFLCIDGTGIIKFIDDYDPKLKKRVMRFKAVDNLNIVADQSADSLQECFGVLERGLLTDSELRGMSKVWWEDQVNKAIAAGKGNTSYTKYGQDIGSGSMVDAGGPIYPVYDYWGQMKLGDITGKTEDADKWVEGHAVIYGVGEKAPILLFAELNKKGYRPYEDCVLKKVIGRRGGRGIPEMLFGTQKYMNMLIEIRKKNAQILQNGIFKAKRGMGLTADTIISKISVGGIIQVDDQDDFQQMPVQDSRAASYSDEDRLLQWGQRNTGAYDIQRGEAIAASAPATSSLIQDRNSRDIFQLVQENVGLMLERLILRHALPWIKENTKEDEIVMITGSVKELEDMDEAIAELAVNRAFVAYVEAHKAYPPNPEQWLVSAKQKQLQVLKRYGNRRYVKGSKGMLDCEVGVIVPVTNEAIDKATIIGKLQEVLAVSSTIPQLNLDPAGIVDTIFDLLKIPTDRIYSQRSKYPTPIERMAARMQAQEMMQQEAQQAQMKNAMTGAVAPQVKASTKPPSVPGLVGQDEDNMTKLNY